MSEAQTSGTKPKKMVDRKLAFALGFVCIVLIAFVSYLTVTGISAQNSYTNLQNQNEQLATQIANQNNMISQLESNITDLQNQIAIANGTIASLEASLTDLINRSILISTVKMASVTKEEGWYSTFRWFNFTVQVKNNGIETVNGTTVMIKLYHDWMNISWPVVNYTNEVEDYKWGGNILRFGAIPAGGNETQSTMFWLDEWGENGMAVLIKYAVATVFLGNITLDKQTVQINETVAGEQTWVFS